jgi:hypothetical protein
MTGKEMDEFHRDFRRYQLALRLVGHRARTRTISRMTALSRHQLARLRQRWGVDEQLRHRGPAPSSLETFTHSPRARSEGAALASSYLVYEALCHCTAGAPAPGPSLEAGERLCEAYEAYRACFPQSGLDFEELLALVAGLTDGHLVGLSRCLTCKGAILIDRLGPPRSTCSHCQAAEAGYALPITAEDVSGESERTQSELF